MTINALKRTGLVLILKGRWLLRMSLKAHEGWCRGPEPMGIITWKHELLVVPFSGKWAA